LSSTDAAPDLGGPWLVVGLGNPGPEYAGNRHNAGAMVLDGLAATLREKFRRKGRSDVLETRLAPSGGRPGERLVLAKPTTYMNTSGGPVAELVRFFRVSPQQVLVVHDELDLPFGLLRLKRAGGAGGHNGLRSISQSLGTKDYCRLRVGVGRPPGRMDAADFVLRDFSSSERKDLGPILGMAEDAVLAVVRDGWERAQNSVNATTLPA
jgi:PTH1 family peptidyl-tRNA hydrolase